MFGEQSRVACLLVNSLIKFSRGLHVVDSLPLRACRLLCEDNTGVSLPSRVNEIFVKLHQNN